MERPPDKPVLTPRAQAQADARTQREALALRDNLRRRKAQARARTPVQDVQQADTPRAGEDVIG